jgi:hypothetical protein
MSRIVGFVLASLLSFNAQAQCISGPNGNCGAEQPQEPSEVNPAPPVIDLGGEPVSKPFLFSSHLDAEGNYFHMLEGLAIMTLEIQKRIPDFQGFPLSIFLDRQYQDCRQAPGQIYSQDEALPHIGVCFVFASQAEAESNYSFGVTTYYQYWDLLQKLIVPVEKACNDKGWKNGNVWKPTSDVANNGVVILERRYCDGKGNALISNFRVEDALGGEVVGTRFKQCDKANQGRLHQIINKKGSALGVGPVFVRYEFNGVEECRKVPNPANRES